MSAPASLATIGSADDELIQRFLKSVAGFADADVSERVGNLRAMFYGNDGTGKTIAGLALLNYIVPEDKTIVLVDSSENWVSLNNHPKLKATLPDGRSPRIVRIPYRSKVWLEQLATACHNKLPPFDRVGGIQFDEWSSMADDMLGKIVDKADELEAPGHIPGMPGWPEYKILTRTMRNLIGTFSRLDGVQCTYIAHWRMLKDGRGLPQEAPNFTPSVGLEIRKPMHLIANLTVDEEGRRVFQVHPDKGHLAKCKIGGLPQYVEFGELAETTKKWLNGEVKSSEENETVAPRQAVKLEDDYPSEPEPESEGFTDL